MNREPSANVGELRGARIPGWIVGLGLVVAGCLIAFGTGGPGWAGLLAAAMAGLTIVTGTGFLIAVAVVAGGRWWLPIRPAAVAIMKTFPGPALLLLAVVGASLTILYPWTDPSIAQSGLLTAKKLAWLNTPLFLARLVAILAIWYLMLVALRNKVLAQGTGYGPSGPDRGLVRVSIAYIILFGLTISIGFWDWGMSLESEWFSTIYGVYGFAAAFKAGIATVILLALRLPAYTSGRLKIGKATRHTLGTLLFAFSMFWAYIWLSQYLLVWYADLPEEATWYTARLGHGWSMLFWINILLGFVVPFFVLLSKSTKTNPWLLYQIAMIVLVGHWLDMVLLTLPSQGGFSLLPLLGAALAAMGLFWIGRSTARGTLAGWQEPLKSGEGLKPEQSAIPSSYA